ncbi:LPXTG cell wall anchor domain-containing protein [Halovivax gelatinilyticus]|uniref:LPXTG cell wall anchor domain-containing protein n=1 Tax=Halovivax gelatinilyticus TaxID=2961597 RepID=UPI0020CA4131|nr:LPXTG cell wall anchor domain-containing protein [Halovivax gelatinilyticus]
MELETFLLATLTAHVGFAIFVTVHAQQTGREKGNWPYLTLAFGLAGIAGYFFYEPDDGAL